MPKKVINGLLIAFCVVIYGAIFLKAFGKKNKVSDSIATIPNFKGNFNSNNTTKDTFKLYVTDRSPFGEPSRSRKVISKPIAKNLFRLEKKETVISWPEISYFGFVKNKNNDQKLAVVKVNNVLYKKREGDELSDGLKIVRAYGDSIIVSYMRNTKTIIRR